MAKDDYHVIVYQVLAYLYQCLKKGIPVEAKNLEHNCKYFQINKNYWAYILYHLQEMNFIEGLGFVEVDGADYPLPVELECCRITPMGIEYLCDNSFMAKAQKFIKEAKDIISPFV